MTVMFDDMSDVNDILGQNMDYNNPNDLDCNFCSDNQMHTGTTMSDMFSIKSSDGSKSQVALMSEKLPELPLNYFDNTIHEANTTELADIRAQLDKELEHEKELIGTHDGISFKQKEHSSYVQSQINRLNTNADKALEDEKWNYDQAERASARGDESLAKKYIEAAKRCHNDYKGYMRSIEAWEG